MTATRGASDRAEIPASVLDRVRERAERAYPEECCGFLVGRRDGGWVRVSDDLAAANAAPESERRRTFVVDPRALLRVMREYRDRSEDVVGFYHSHPDHDARLSPTDLEFAAHWPRTLWLVVPVAEDGVGVERAWWIGGRTSSESAPETMEMQIRPPDDSGRALTTESLGGWR